MAIIISSVNPDNGLPSGGTFIEIVGTGFPSGAGVEIDGIAAIFVDRVSPTQITCMTPPHAPGQVDLVVFKGGSSHSDTFAYNAPACRYHGGQ